MGTPIGITRAGQNSKPTISIVGGGIAGLTAAIALEKTGLSPVVFEAAATVEPLGAGLVLASNAMKALKELGIAEAIMKKGSLLDSFTINDQSGKPIFKKNSEDIKLAYGLDNFAIHRAELHQALLSHLKEVPVHTNMRALSANQDEQGVRITFEDGTVHASDYLIVADGIHSPIRQALAPGSIPRYAGYTCWRAVIDGIDLDLHDAYETWGHKGRFGYVPMDGKKLYWFACINAPQQSPVMKPYGIAALFAQFKNFHTPIPKIISSTKDENLIWNDIMDLKPLKQYAFGKIVLIGDAAHATTPNLGQGACMAIEDAVILAREMNKNHNYTEAFKNYEKRRLKRTHYIIKTSRLMGRIAQIENIPVGNLRNTILRVLPSNFNDKQIKALYDIYFS